MSQVPVNDPAHKSHSFQHLDYNICRPPSSAAVWQAQEFFQKQDCLCDARLERKVVRRQLSVELGAEINCCLLAQCQ